MTLHPFPALWQRITGASVARLLIAAAAVALTVWAEFGAPHPLSYFGNEWLRDSFIKLKVTVEEEPRVLVVDIDESSLKRLGPWPWPRERIAAMVEQLLTEYDARGVALDIVLPKAGDASGDKRLALLAEHGPVVLAQAFDYQPNRPEPLHDGVVTGGMPARHPGAAQATGYIANHAGLSGAQRVGNIGFIPDPGGVIRKVPLVTQFGGRDYPALAYALLACCSGAKLPPLGDGGMMRIDYRRDWNAYTVVSAADVLTGELSPEGIKGRLVVVGSSSMGMADRVATPLAANRPGLGVQATFLSTLLDLQQGATPARWPGAWIALAFSLAATLLTMVALPRLSALASATLLGALVLAWLGIAFAVTSHDPDFVTTGPLASLLFLMAVAVPYQWHLTQRRSRRLLDTLRQYVAPAVVEELLRSDIEDPLKPRLLDVTTLIADMEGYTAQVESLSMEEAAELTRVFLDCLTGPVMHHGGTLDKYTGDGLVAFWGAPLPNPRHADQALTAAREIVRRVSALSAEREADGKPRLRVRIGIESGPAMAGDFGTSFRSIYTAVGDSVNTASRLEQAARDYPHDVIIGAGTVERSREHEFMLLGERQLRGKERTTTVYTLTPDHAHSTQAGVPAQAELAR